MGAPEIKNNRPVRQPAHVGRQEQVKKQDKGKLDCDNMPSAVILDPSICKVPESNRSAKALVNNAMRVGGDAVGKLKGMLASKEAQGIGELVVGFSMPSTSPGFAKACEGLAAIVSQSFEKFGGK